MVPLFAVIVIYVISFFNFIIKKVLIFLLIFFLLFLMK